MYSRSWFLNSTVYCECLGAIWRSGRALFGQPSFPTSGPASTDGQSLKCRIRGWGTLHSGLGPWKWSCAFP